MTPIEYFGTLGAGIMIGFGIGIWYASKYRKNK